MLCAEVTRIIRELKAEPVVQIETASTFCRFTAGVPSLEKARDIAEEAKREAGTPYLFFNGYTNGCNSYLPTAEEYDKGGYEVLRSNLVYFPYHGRVMPFNRDTAKRLIGKIVEDWKHRDTFLSL